MKLLSQLKKILNIVPENEQEASFGIETPPRQEPNPNAKKGIEPPAMPPAPQKRNEICRFILKSLKPYIDEKESIGTGLKLYVLCKTTEELEITRVALFEELPSKFKNDILQKELADNYIRLSSDWTFEFLIVQDTLPACRFSEGNFGLDILKNQSALKDTAKAYLASIIVLDGQASQQTYVLNPDHKIEFRIGRGYRPRLNSGRTRINDIVFLEKDDTQYDETKGDKSLSVSRNHATIKFDKSTKKYFLYVDEGGLPQSHNRTKILKENNTTLKLQVLGMPYELMFGDEIELGDGALIAFSAYEGEL